MHPRSKAPFALLALALALLAPAAEARKTLAPEPERPVPVNNTTLTRYLDRLTVQKPLEHQGMAVYPLTSASAFALGETMTLDEALKKGSLKVTEMGSGAQVNTVILENTGDKPIFIMSGEIIQGAKQDRTMQADLLAPAHSGKMQVSVFCTEHGRWVEKTTAFQAADAAVPNSVRGVAKAAKSQSRVWDSIASNQEKRKVSAPTGAAKEVYADRKVQADLKPYLERLADAASKYPRTVGVVATHGSKLVAVDVFGDNELLKRLYPKLLRSYAVDVAGDTWSGSTDAELVKVWLHNAATATWTRNRTDGVGLALEFSGKGQHGSALLNKDMVYHSDIFVGEKEASGGMEDQQRINTPNLQIRRDGNGARNR